MDNNNYNNVKQEKWNDQAWGFNEAVHLVLALKDYPPFDTMSTRPEWTPFLQRLSMAGSMKQPLVEIQRNMMPEDLDMIKRAIANKRKATK